MEGGDNGQVGALIVVDAAPFAPSADYTGKAAYLIPAYSGLCVLLSTAIRLAPSRLARCAGGPSKALIRIWLGFSLVC